MLLVRAGKALEIAQVDGVRVRDWRRHGFLNGVGVLVDGRWHYAFRDIVVLRLSGMLGGLGIGPTSAVALARKVAATDLTRAWLMIGSEGAVHYFDDFDGLIAERQKRRYLVAVHVPLGEVVKDVRDSIE